MCKRHLIPTANDTRTQDNVRAGPGSGELTCTASEAALRRSPPQREGPRAGDSPGERAGERECAREPGGSAREAMEPAATRPPQRGLRCCHGSGAAPPPGTRGKARPGGPAPIKTGDRDTDRSSLWLQGWLILTSAFINK